MNLVFPFALIQGKFSAPVYRNKWEESKCLLWADFMECRKMDAF